ncbi:SMI1/KNR4 family protein [Lentibacillus sp. CBA3610]|uniref:SMI1/KNR4 family protein n=1 Tax=Lentibacillus sp. CBA3610 TaxID=2518176 RepID=UPI00159534C1|nr:SMI1/KNR4 family protein [Lentibacillus sp. CBA3610]QKY69393.1 SMI1/KNR4 family protein [Lentibacillus sp. CBA3610]
MIHQSFVHLTLQGLKRRLDKDNNLLIQKPEGMLLKAECKFNEPASLKDINDFEKETGWKIPDDLQNFLLHHNGALIFESEYGGGMELFSLNEMKSNHLSHMPGYCYPIGYYAEEYLFVNSEKCEDYELDYLLWDDSSSPVDRWERLNSNFELWFDRFIISQGSHFWEWNIIKPENYYK